MKPALEALIDLERLAATLRVAIDDGANDPIVTRLLTGATGRRIGQARELLRLAADAIAPRMPGEVYGRELDRAGV